MILPDYPIENEKDDQLRRAPLANKVAEVINSFESKESFVIGIEGPWGSGKTSFINLVRNNLDREKTTSFIFNPWNFSDETSLLQDFFARLTQEVEGVDKDSGKRLKKYATKLTDVVPEVSAAFISINTQKLFGTDTSLEKERIGLDNELSKIGKKIVVVIDDIDRLDQRDTKLIFKLVKLTANFPNTIFILSYSREQVEKRISDKDAGIDGGDYLRKIVQVSFTLPLPDQQELRGILFKYLDETIKKLYPNEDVLKDKSEESRWSDLLYHGFGDLFTTVRDINRYISSLRLNWPIVGTVNVNKTDFLGIEAVWVFAPRFYNAIPANEDIFIQSRKSRMSAHFSSESKEAEMRRKRLQDLLNELVHSKEREYIEAICTQLFPQISQFGHGSEEAQEREKMIAHPERFKFYFQLGIPSGEVSETQVQTVIDAAGDKESFKVAILQAKENNYLRKLLRRLIMRRSELGEEKIKNIISVFWTLEKDIAESKEIIFDFDDVDTQVMRFGYNALLEVMEDRRTNLALELYREGGGLYSPLHLLHVLADKESRGETKLGEQTITELKKIVVEKIDAATKANTLKDDDKLIAILYRWKEWGSAESVSNFIKDWVSARNGLLAFLQACVGRVLSSSGNYNDLNQETISGLYSLDEIKKLVDAITEEEIATMSDRQKEAVSLFKNRQKRF